MRRRQVLALGGVLGISTVAGCLDALDASAPDEERQAEDSDRNPAETPTPDEPSRDTPTPEDSSRDTPTPDESVSDSQPPDGSTVDDPPPGEPASTTPEQDESSDGEGFDPTEHIDDWQDTRVRGTGEKIEVTVTLDSAVAMDLKCARAAKDAVGSLLDKRLPQPIGYYGVGRDPEGEHEYIIRVGRTLTVKQNGTIALSPELPFDMLRSLTPRAVEVTADYEGTERTCTHPVYVQDRVLFSD
jgi:hypothetical protein